MKKQQQTIMWVGIVLELAGIILITRTMGSDSSPAMGIALVALGLVIVIIGMASMKKDANSGAS